MILFVDFKTDLSTFIVSGKNAEAMVLANEMQTGTLSRRYLISISASPGLTVANSFSEQFSKEIQLIDGVTAVWSADHSADYLSEIASIYQRMGSAFYSLYPDQHLQHILTPQWLQQRAEFVRNALLSPQAPLIKKMVVNDPLLLNLEGFRSVAGQAKSTQTTTDQYANWIVETAYSGMNAAQQSRISQSIQQTFQQLNQTRNITYTLEMTGVPVFAVATQTLIQGDVVNISVLSSIALICLFLLIFRSFSSLITVFTVLLTAILSAMLITQSIFGYVHGLTIAIGATLSGICIDYPIHSLVHASGVQASQRSISIKRIWPSMLLGGLTSLIGYSALGFSGYPGFRQVSVFAVSSIVIALLMTRFFLPGILKNQPIVYRNMPGVTTWLWLSRRYSKGLITVLILTVLVASFNLKSLNWLQDLQQLTPELDQLKQLDKQIRARMTPIEPGRFVLVSGETTEQALQNAERVYPMLDQMKADGTLDHYFGVYPWLLSSKQQTDNQILLSEVLTDEILQHWKQALQQQKLAVEKLSQLDYPIQEPMTLEDLTSTPVNRMIENQILVTNDKTLVLIWLGKHQPEAMKFTLTPVENAMYFSQRELINEMTNNYTERAKILLSAGLAIIFILLTINYQSLFKAFITLLPAITAAMLMLLFWSLSAQPISFLHLVGFLLVIAICVDYGIFFQENRGGDIQLTYQAISASMLTSMLAFGSLITAQSSMLTILAGVVALGVLLGFLLCPVLIRTKSWGN